MVEKVIDKQKLNEKIAKWAGFQCGYWELNNQEIWLEPNEKPPDKIGLRDINDYKCPPFDKRMDLCEKWIVPILKNRNIEFRIELNEDKRIYVGIYRQEPYLSFTASNDNSLPLTFCLALEKYIDWSEKQNADKD